MAKIPEYVKGARTHRDYDAQVDAGTVRRSFGVKDRLGREIGGIGYRWDNVVFRPAPEDANYWNCTPEGTYFAFCPHASRNGKPYGAIQRDQFYTTAAERDAAMETYFTNAAKRAAKR
jgi:hypothetical protein